MERFLRITVQAVSALALLASSAGAEPPATPTGKPPPAEAAPPGQTGRPAVAPQQAPAAPEKSRPAAAAQDRMRQAHRKASAALKVARESPDEAERQAARQQMREARSEMRRSREEVAKELREKGALEGPNEVRASTPGEHIRAQRTARVEAWKLRRERGQGRIDAARREAWQRWRARIEARGGFSEGLEQELKRHARRIARLRRIRSMAATKGDQKVIARATKLIAREEQRHRRRMDQLLEKGEQP